MTKPLPEFENPPVVEVALGVQFEKLESVRTAQLGYVWQAFRRRFPQTEEHPPLDPAFENFRRERAGRSGMRVEFTATPPIPRLWFWNEGRTELVQVQQDRFLRNWRKRDDNDQYPRYGSIRQAFRDDFDVFRKLVENEQWGMIEPNQCEVTYVNLIAAGEGWQEHGQLDRVCTLFNLRYSDEDMGPAEEAAVSGKFVLKGEDARPVGRLHVAVNPVVRVSDNQAAIRLTLTARGAPAGEGFDGVFDFFDRGHEAIVRTFTSITTAEMHKVWKRTR